MSLPSEGQSLSANQISSRYLKWRLRYNYFRFRNTNVRHIGVLLLILISTTRPVRRNMHVILHQGAYSRKVVKGGQWYDRSYDWSATAVGIHETNRTYDRPKIRSYFYDIPAVVVRVVVNRSFHVESRTSLLIISVILTFSYHLTFYRVVYILSNLTSHFTSP